MSDSKIDFIVPRDAKGNLKWLFIDGEGKKDLQDKYKYTAQVVLTPDAAAPYIAELKELWEEYRPASWKVSAADVKKKTFPGLVAGDPKPAHSMGYKEDEDGNFAFNFKTNVAYADGTAKVVDIYNAKAHKISLGGKKIGNGSLGALSGIADGYQGGGNCGVTLYLNAVQLTKFVEFNDASDEEGFEGVDDSMAGFEPQSDSEEVKPRL